MAELPPRFSETEAEGYLRSLELFGMRFGLEKMRRMLTVLGSPQRSFGSLHIVGTNGKTSTARMAAAILARHGLATATYTSPHLVSYRERVQIGGRDLRPDEFAAAVARAAWAAQRVNRTLADDERVTQFEALTAAAFWAMAERDVDVAVIEAGLGGRYDATNVIDSRVTVLTNVALEHTRWLGPTVRDIAEEKLAVLRPHTALVLGSRLAVQAQEVAARIAHEQGARIVRAQAPDEAAQPPLRARGRFQRENFALARFAVQAYLEGEGSRLREERVAQAAAGLDVPGRLDVLATDPLTVLDAAHNPHAAAALVDSLAELVGERPLGLLLGVLDDKDAAGMLDLLLPLSQRAWFTAPASARALSPAALRSRSRQVGFEAASCEPDAHSALLQAQAWARERDGAVLATGSVYLVGQLLSQATMDDANGRQAEHLSSSQAARGREPGQRAARSRGGAGHAR